LEDGRGGICGKKVPSMLPVLERTIDISIGESGGRVPSIPAHAKSIDEYGGRVSSIP
jgi:hypothetical protein